MSGSIFSQLFCNVVFFAMAMYQMEMVRNSFFAIVRLLRFMFFFSFVQTLENIDIAFFYSVLCMFVGLAWTFLLCFFATSAAESLTSIGNIAFNSNWYRYPSRIQRHSVLLIARSQKPIYFSGFKMVRCTLESFAKVSRDFFTF